MGAALPPTGLIPLGGRAQVSPAQAPSGLRNPLFVLSLPTLQLRCPAVTQTSPPLLKPSPCSLAPGGSELLVFMALL